MINMLVDVCTKDETPIEVSLCYLTLVETVGFEEAQKWVREVEVLGDP